MKGGIRNLVIPYHLGYGEKGRPGLIPPRATLYFTIKLMGSTQDSSFVGAARSGDGQLHRELLSPI